MKTNTLIAGVLGAAFLLIVGGAVMGRPVTDLLNLAETLAGGLLGYLGKSAVDALAQKEQGR